LKSYSLWRIDDHIVFIDNRPGSDVSFSVEAVFGAEFSVANPRTHMMEGGIELSRQRECHTRGLVVKI